MTTLIFDLETSGLPATYGFSKYYDPSKLIFYDSSRIVELAYQLYESKNLIKEYSQIIKPVGFKISNERFHGISHKKALDEGENILDVLEQLTNDIESKNSLTIVSHNLAFDYNILLSECHRNKHQKLNDLLSKANKYCTMKGGKQLIQTRKHPKLTELYKYLFDEPINQEHRALSDTQICAKCYFAMPQPTY